MTTTAEKIRVMQAWIDGKDIQCCSGDGRWFLLSECPSIEPSWDWGSRTYRVKPKPRQFWIVQGATLYSVCPEPSVHYSQAGALEAARRSCGTMEVVHAMEVTE